MHGLKRKLLKRGQDVGCRSFHMQRDQSEEFICDDCKREGKPKTTFFGEFQFLMHRAFKHDDWDGLDAYYERRGKANPYL